MAGGAQISPGQTRGSGISGGEERKIAKGDFIRVPPGVPHWVKKIEGKEIVVASARPWSYFNVSFHVLEEHDIAHEPSSETRDVPSHAEITGQSVSE